MREVMAETLWPTRCAVCDAPGMLLCAECERALRFVDVLDACPACGAPFGRIVCTECCETTLSLHGRKHLPLDAMACALIADEGAQRIVTTFKDRGEMRLAPLIAGLMHRFVPPAWLDGRPALSFVPASRQARIRRGFDHCERIAMSLAGMTGLPLACLLDRPDRADQRRLSRSKRVRNQARAFTVSKTQSIPESVLIVDDICTTGATLYAAADALREGGVQQVLGLTFGRVID